jgi:hypothetical protein
MNVRIEAKQEIIANNTINLGRSAIGSSDNSATDRMIAGTTSFNASHENIHEAGTKDKGLGDKSVSKALQTIANPNADDLYTNPVFSTAMRLTTQGYGQSNYNLTRSNTIIGGFLSGQTQPPPAFVQIATTPLLSFNDNRTKLKTSAQVEPSTTSEVDEKNPDDPLLSKNLGFEAIC